MRLEIHGDGPLYRDPSVMPDAQPGPWAPGDVREIFACGASAPAQGEDGPPGGDGGGDEPRRPGGPAERLRRGDHPELAERLLTELAAGGEPVVFDEGAMWRYEPRSGLWVAFRRHELEVRVAAYAGLPCARERDPEVTLKYLDLVGAVNVAQAMARSDGFFRDAAPGVCFSNGFLRVDDGRHPRLEPHSPAHRARHALPVPWVQHAPSPRWNAYWDEVFSGVPVDDLNERFELVQEFVGACLLGRATEFQRCLVLLGEGANGKSVCLDVVASMFPPGSVTHVPPQEWAREYSIAQLRGSLLNSVSELPERDILEGDRFKAVVTGDPVTARAPYEPAYSFRPRAGQLFAANKLPAFRDRSHGFLRRFLVVPFERQFDPKAADKTLAGRIVQTELAGVVCWALEGAARLLRRGHYREARASDEAKRDWQRSNDSPLEFLVACARDVVAPSISAPETVAGQPHIRAEDLYTAYRHWCTKAGFLAVNIRAFGQSVKGAVQAKRTKSGVVYFCRVVDPYSFAAESAAALQGELGWN